MIVDMQPVIYIVQGIGITLLYTLVSLLGGSLLGITLALLRFYKIGSPLINSLISFLRGTPLLVQLTLIYFVLPHLLGISIPIIVAGIIAFSLNSSAYIAEIIKAGLNSVDKGQFEVSKALGIPPYLMWKDIILPQAIKTILPALINEAISLLKETALISTLGEQDIMRRAQLVAAEHYTYITPLCIAAVCYYGLTFLLENLAKIVEKRGAYDYSTRS